MRVGLCFLLFYISLQTEHVSAATDKIVCYFGSWAKYRPSLGHFDVEDINPNLCTHIIYSFLGINADGSVKIIDYQNALGQGALSRFTNLKNNNPNLKTLFAIGGWEEGSVTFSYVSKSAILRALFIQNVINLIQQYNFDGCDLDWEYPAQRGGTPQDKDNFITWLSEFRSSFDNYGYILSAAVPALGTLVDDSYHVPQLSLYLDFINVMTYDFHGSWDGITGQNAPLYMSSATDITESARLHNVHASIQGWISRGADPAKLILGVGGYGSSYTLANSLNTYLGASVLYGGNAGPYSATSGTLFYNEICEMICGGGWTVVWDDEQKVPYAYSGSQWVGYDNEVSIQYKVNYALYHQLGGVMLWTIDTDDFRGTCGKVYPILNTIKQELEQPTLTIITPTNGTIIDVDDTCQNSTLIDNDTTTTTAGPIDICVSEGYVQDPVDCSKFHYCQLIGNSFLIYDFNCPHTLYFDPKHLICNYQNQVECTNQISATTSTTEPTTTSTTESTTTSTVESTTVQSTTVSTSIPVTQSAVGTTNVCTTEGYIRNPEDCNKFHYCQLVGSTFIILNFTCPSTLYYDNDGGFCNYMYLVEC